MEFYYYNTSFANLETPLYKLYGKWYYISLREGNIQNINTWFVYTEEYMEPYKFSHLIGIKTFNITKDNKHIFKALLEYMANADT